MTTLSIYQKTCPACLTILSVNAERCDCGYRFGAKEAEAGVQEDRSAEEEEELYRAYLAARLEQAVTRLEEARAALAAEPQNFDRAREVMKLLHEVMQLRAEKTAFGEIAHTAQEAGDAGSAEPTEAFRAVQAARAEAAMARLAQVPTRECPVCHARLPSSCARCFCGHLFATAERAPRPIPPPPRGAVHPSQN